MSADTQTRAHWVGVTEVTVRQPSWSVREEGVPNRSRLNEE